MGSITQTFDYASLKELLKDTKADVLLPGDGQKYEDIIQRWSESCVKRAVCHTSAPLASPTNLYAVKSKKGRIG
jgi:hypothetical protein